MKLMMLGDFTLREEEDEVEDREVIDINKDNFNDVMASQRLSLQFTVPNQLSGEEGEELPVDLKVSNMRDFEPESVVRQVPELNKLLELRDALAFLKGPLGNVPAFRKQIDALEERVQVLEKIVTDEGYQVQKEINKL